MFTISISVSASEAISLGLANQLINGMRVASFSTLQDCLNLLDAHQTSLEALGNAPGSFYYNILQVIQSDTKTY